MKAHELGERIEATRFLGREFLVFLWFLSELDEGTLDVPGLPPVELAFDGSLVLERMAESVESCRLKAQDPTASREAKESLRDGKLPTKVHAVVTVAEKTFSFQLDADSLSLRGVKIPALLGDREDEAFFERMQLVEELEDVLERAFRDFLALRTSSEWHATVAPAIRRWVRGEPTLTREAYVALRDRMVTRGKGR